ncbi:MAG TPA: DUF2442 domain-containing protein [Actinomycetota bacterium]|nr:DUF2442 domain-containing protein [Actinomycetota bacterium]
MKAEYLGPFLINVTFSDGLKGTIDFEGWLDGPVFERLKEEELFKQFVLEAGSLSWPNGADIAPEALYERAKSSTTAV